METDVLEELRKLRAEVEELRKRPAGKLQGESGEVVFSSTNLSKVSRFLEKNPRKVHSAESIAKEIGTTAKEVVRSMRKFQAAKHCGVSLPTVDSSFNFKYFHIYAALRKNGSNKTEFDYFGAYGRSQIAITDDVCEL